MFFNSVPSFKGIGILLRCDYLCHTHIFSEMYVIARWLLISHFHWTVHLCFCNLITYATLSLKWTCILLQQHIAGMLFQFCLLMPYPHSKAQVCCYNYLCCTPVQSYMQVRCFNVVHLSCAAFQRAKYVFAMLFELTRAPSNWFHNSFETQLQTI